ncbi:MAG: 50S ribosomal protein L31e [Candidatus Nitrosocaldus sp.]|nr:50S ribosomal protein L31e [Candidatus Nitrosocaldus sp.]
MSSEGVEERVYTINLGRVTLAPDNRRSKRAINMIREFAVRHMKSEEVVMDEELNEMVWSSGMRSPPRRIRVVMSKDASGVVTIKPYRKENEGKVEEKEEKEGEGKVKDGSTDKTEKTDAGVEKGTGN